jgi:hypothetical protein
VQKITIISNNLDQEAEKGKETSAGWAKIATNANSCSTLAKSEGFNSL